MVSKKTHKKTALKKIQKDISHLQAFDWKQFNSKIMMQQIHVGSVVYKNDLGLLFTRMMLWSSTIVS